MRTVTTLVSALALLAALSGLPGASARAAEPIAAVPAVPAVPAAAADDSATPSTAGEIFMTLFKHLEPHAVTALWLGGEQALVQVLPIKPTATDDTPAYAFGSRDELEAHYAADMGGGFGLLIYNINTVQWIAAILLIVLMVGVARSARRMAGNTPHGPAFHIVESIILFVRDDVVYTVMGKHHGRRFVPLFLTQFFFVLFMNILGLIYLGSVGGTATANLAVTLGLALTTLFWIHFAGIREHGFFHHWKNFIPHGLPWFVLPIIIPVEILGMVVKPAALTIRLFANLTAGHLVMLGFFGLVYLFGALGLPALAMAIVISVLELFVCFVQAYIFTYLSVIFVGASVHPEH